MAAISARVSFTRRRNWEEFVNLREVTVELFLDPFDAERFELSVDERLEIVSRTSELWLLTLVLLALLVLGTATDFISNSSTLSLNTWLSRVNWSY